MTVTTFDRIVFLICVLSLISFAWWLTRLWPDVRRRLRPRKRTADATIRLLTGSGEDATELVRLAVQMEEFAPRQYQTTSDGTGPVMHTGTARFLEIDCPSLGVHKKLLPVVTDGPRNNCMWLGTNLMLSNTPFVLTKLTITDDREQETS